MIKNLKKQPRLLSSIFLLFLLSTGLCFAQQLQSQPPRTDLLTMNGNKPSLSATGEGITSYKTDDIYNRGTTRVRLVKAAESRFKIELPIGYTIFNDLIYAVETDAVFTGPSDIVFNLPSARTKETFAQLRILYPEFDYADPEVPKWIDATLDADSAGVEKSLTESAIKERLPNFKSRTLHAFSDQDAPLVFVVALRDPAKVRNKLTADLELTGNGTPQITEGRSITYELKITNKGPDTATGISLHATPSFSFESVKTSREKCKMSGQNVYCKFASLEKGSSIEIKIVERSEWGMTHANVLPTEEKPSWLITKIVSVGATEKDPFAENNELDLTTEVFPDPNKGPVIEIVSPTLFQLFTGPGASVPIRFRASDPDGFIKKVELFTENKSLGEATLRSDGEYELIYKDVPFGRHWVTIVATDNLDRVAAETAPEFFVNGPAKLEITSPKPGSTLSRTDGELTITIHATSRVPLKKISLDLWESDATAVGNDDYVVKLRSCTRKCRLQAIAIDEKGVETRSEYVEFTIATPPSTTLAWYDGEYVQQFEAGKTMKVDQLILLASANHEAFNDAEITKIDIFVDGRLICTDNSPTQFGYGGECVWKPSPGKYRLHAVATDSDGAVGKSEVIEVSIERP